MLDTRLYRSVGNRAMANLDRAVAARTYQMPTEASSLPPITVFLQIATLSLPFLTGFLPSAITDAIKNNMVSTVAY